MIIAHTFHFKIILYCYFYLNYVREGEQMRANAETSELCLL